MPNQSSSTHPRDSRLDVALKLERQDQENLSQKILLTQRQSLTAQFIKFSGFNTVIRKVLFEFDTSHKHSEWGEKDATPLGGQSIEGHQPIFALKPNYPESKITRIPGYNYQVRFGPGKPSFEIIATVCIEETEIYLAVSFVTVNGLSHTSSRPTIYDSREKIDLETWLRSLCKLYSQPQVIQVLPDFHLNSAESIKSFKKQERRIFLPD